MSGWRQYLGEAALRSAAARELVPAARGDGPDGHGRKRDMATGPAHATQLPKCSKKANPYNISNKTSYNIV